MEKVLDVHTVSSFPKIRSSKKLYSLSEVGAGARLFHERCDNQGPTVILVRANTNYIFGGFNPSSWMAECVYSESNDAFLFSLMREGQKGCIKCEVRKERADKAIKLNEAQYSPGFGESDISDLFISFKAPSKSYSLLGNVYKLPKGERGDHFLAGKPSDWKVHEIEIYSVEII